MPENTKNDGTSGVELLGADNLSFAEFERLRETGQTASQEKPSEEAAEAQPAKTAADSETAEEPEEQEEPSEPGGDKPGSEAAPTEGAPPKKKQGSFQKKIDKLTREKRELQRRLEALETQKSPGGEGSSEAQAMPDKTAEPDDGRPKPEDFETYEEYLDKFADWKAERREAAQAEKARRDTALKAYDSRENAARAAHPDYDEVLAEVNDIALPDHLVLMLFEHERGPELAYALAQKREDLERIVSLPPLVAAQELGKFEASLSSKTAPEPKSTPAGSQAEGFRRTKTRHRHHRRRRPGRNEPR